MANVRVSLLRYVKSDRGWKRVRVHEEETRKGRGWTIDWELTKSYGPGIAELGQYQLKWHEGSKAQYEGVGYDLREAVIARDKKASLLAAENAAEKAGVELVPDDPTRKTLQVQKEEFMRLKEATDRHKWTLASYEHQISEFLTICQRKYADHITQQDILDYLAALRKRGLSRRSVANYYVTLCTFLNFLGVDHKKIVEKVNRPRFQEKVPESYTKDEVTKFLVACPEGRYRLLFEFLLQTGVREREATYLEWRDIDFAGAKVKLQGEKIMHFSYNGREWDEKFETKTKRDRVIPLPSVLLEKLKTWKERNPKTKLVFGTRNDCPDNHFVEECKRFAREAGLNCGECESCRGTTKRGVTCERWYLHKWRSTYATWSLRAGIDLKTVQHRLGHTEISMTARYLSPDEKGHDKLNEVFAGV